MWCYNHEGIGEGSSPGAFFTNDWGSAGGIVELTNTYSIPQSVGSESDLYGGEDVDVESFYFVPLSLITIGSTGAGGSGPTAANNGSPQQPSKTQERLERLKNCALGYYGIDPLSVAGLSSGAKWALIASAAGGIPKAVPDALGMRVIMLPGSSRFTSLLSMLSVAGGGGALRTIANFGSKWAGPIAVASAVIDATAIGVCTASD